jgi:hypothetical protein
MSTAAVRSGSGTGRVWTPNPGPTRQPPIPPTTPPSRGRRRPAALVAGVALATFGGLGGAWLVSDAGHRMPVLVMARSVPAGTTIAAADLRQAEASLEAGTGTVPASHRQMLVGKVAQTDLFAGSLVPPGAIGDASPPLPGTELVVLALPSSRMPASGLHPGDQLLVILTPLADTDAPDVTPTSVPAQVVRGGDADVNGLISVDVTVTNANGSMVATRAATGRIAVVVEPRTKG